MSGSPESSGQLPNPPGGGAPPDLMLLLDSRKPAKGALLSLLPLPRPLALPLPAALPRRGVAIKARPGRGQPLCRLLRIQKERKY